MTFQFSLLKIHFVIVFHSGLFDELIKFLSLCMPSSSHHLILQQAIRYRKKLWKLQQANDEDEDNGKAEFSLLWHFHPKSFSSWTYIYCKNRGAKESFPLLLSFFHSRLQNTISWWWEETRECFMFCVSIWIFYDFLHLWYRSHRMSNESFWLFSSPTHTHIFALLLLSMNDIFYLSLKTVKCENVQCSVFLTRWFDFDFAVCTPAWQHTLLTQRRKREDDDVMRNISCR